MSFLDSLPKIPNPRVFEIGEGARVTKIYYETSRQNYQAV